ncbi:MAG: response regulator, partial [Planctomycetota bacterium]
MAEATSTQSKQISRILIVDDEQDHAEVMCEALDRAGHTCDVSHSLPEARKNLKKRKYDVIVTDLRMDGDRDGLELLVEAGTLEPAPPV